LTNQSQPHFLFNSLNTLRDIIDQESKDEAKKFVDQLAGVYRFILESGDSNLISLDQEIKFAKAYLNIQKERFGNNLVIHWNVSNECMAKKVAPMSLQLLIQNAIKHNVISNLKPLIIDISCIGNELIVQNKIQIK